MIGVRTITTVMAKDGQESALKALMLEVAELARQEPGCLRYDLWQGHANPAEFTAIGEWQDEIAFQTYYRSAYLEELMREIPDIIAHPLDVQWYVPVG
ncbi:putative quinol monooxygenase [Phormidium sp. FACHB-1136]|uniref:putative quinol monooxygenase n=1 Tax=Phormidium sp. FACHB-1136 TaxID=2692848 RepID=UPI001683DDC4|nr:putative quinol monooxygenase [Phormidium sp. FACHB-1136]MBD2425060.1 antibiotic biosynthesis monooxygenase [Phormidium sp. FACHB-1136]